jgi:hypothetical protein
LVRIRDLHTLYFGETIGEGSWPQKRRSGYIGKEGASDAVLLLDTLSAYICTENFEEREQRRGYLDRGVLEYMKGRS